MNRRISTKSWGGRRKRLYALALAFALAAGTVLAGLGAGPMRAHAAEGTQTVYRLYNGANQEHLYTTDANEVRVLVAAHGWIYEGSAWEAPGSGTPVYRLYNQGLDNHLYTTDTNEIAVLTNAYGWVQDNDGNPLFYSGGDKDIYRLYNEPLRGMHLLSTDLNEYNTLAMPEYGSWEQEGAKLNCVELGNPKLPLPGEEQPAPTEPTPAPEPTQAPEPSPAPTEPTPAPIAPGAVKYSFWPEYDGRITFVSKYDGNSMRELGSTGYEENGAFRFCDIYEYDAAGKKVKWTRQEADGKNSYTTYEYDAAGRLVKEVSVVDNQQAEDSEWVSYRQGNLIYEYDAQGRLAKKTLYFLDGEIGYCYTYEYDSAGNMVREDSGGSYNTYEYSPEGYLLKETRAVLRPDGVYNVFRTEYEYDAFGYAVRIRQYDQYGEIEVELVDEHDAELNTVKRTWYYADDEVTYYQTYEYDADGNLSKCMSLVEDGRVQYCTYVLDAGNQTLKYTIADQDGRTLEEVTLQIR